MPGMTYGQQNKLELLGRACGSPPEEERCGCSNLGQEGQPHPSNPETTAQCGYSLRLWFYPCEGIDPDKVEGVEGGQGDVGQILTVRHCLGLDL